MEKKKNNNRKNIINKKVHKKNNLVRIKSDFTSQNFINTKQLKVFFLVAIAILFLLIVRLFVLQFINSSFLKEKAYSQQSINQIISPKRGNIYDATGKVLASSVPVDTVTINPTKIQDKSDEKTTLLKEKIAKGLSDIFELDYDETLKKVNSHSSVQTIAKKVEKNKIDTLKTWMKENDITIGINIDEDTKRYYPYDNVLSNVLGFCGTDNEGIIGIESTFESVLQGTPGKIVSSKGSNQKEIPNSEKSYIAAENGSDLTLTIDFNIQMIIEKYLKQAFDTQHASGATCIAMEPKTGKIKAMANYPNYNLNTPFAPNDIISKDYDKSSDEQRSILLNNMWKNNCVTDLYEPGSVFKLITASVALEEHIVDPEEYLFNCNGYEQVADRKIHCWSATPHGSLSLRKALEKSCNPAFMQLGKKIGADKLYKYYQAYGFMDKTGSNLAGESNSLFAKESSVGDVELATMSFGQGLNITPLQMISAISAIANDGILMKPTIVDKITNADTGAITNIDSVPVRQVLSKETAATMRELMNSVVVNGTAYRGSVTGYSVGGKTGTSEPANRNSTTGYVASFAAISPVEDTQITLLLCLYGLDKGKQGGQVAAPVVSQMLTEILPYMGVPSDASLTTTTSKLNYVPDVRNKTFAESIKNLANLGFNVKSVTGKDKNSTTVFDQVPKPGVSLPKDSVIILYDDASTTRTSVTVPDLSMQTAYQVKNNLRALNLNVSIDGSGTVVSQDPPANSKVEEGSIIKVNLKQTSKAAH